MIANDTKPEVVLVPPLSPPACFGEWGGYQCPGG